jgi:uncharacterized protein (DUF885 family)
MTTRTKSRSPKYLPKPRVIARIPTIGMIVLLIAMSAAGHAVAQPPSLEKTSSQARAQALNVLFKDYWEDHLRQSPEVATALGDKRYNDRWSDLSRVETERSLRRNREYVKRLRALGTAELQVVDYFHEHSSVDETNVQRETDRYIAWPGQALGYKVGQLKLLELRQRAESQLGAKFDIWKFHDLILDSGALPLDVLDTHVTDWIASQK